MKEWNLRKWRETFLGGGEYLVRQPERGPFSWSRENGMFRKDDTMSYSQMKAVFLGDRVEVLEEFKNSHGTAPVIWGSLCERYLNTGNWLFAGDALWTIHKRADIPMHQRMVMMMTYDNMVVLKKDYKKAAQNIFAFLQDFPPKLGYVNHWERIAEIFESDPDCPAIGFHFTSVNEDPFNGPWNEEIEDYDPPNWEKYWSVYDEELRHD